MLALVISIQEGRMDVTRKNFAAVLSEFPDVIKNAQFLAFDTEFTGLIVEGATGSNYFDTLEDLYLQYSQKVEKFMAIQLGIVAFSYNEMTKKYTHQAYNFYVYPSTYSDINFTCQSKSIEYLIQHGFDFNKLFKEGIPYLRDSEVEKLLERLEEKYSRNVQSDNVSKMDIPIEHSGTISTIINKIEEILQTKSKQVFTTEKNNSYVRKLIYSTVQTKYGNTILLESNKDETMTISVGYTGDEIKELQRENFLKEKQKILEEAGICKIIKLIMESEKLMVGHNLYLDILFIIKQFIRPLPSSYSEFKELVHFLFPKIVDTKFMASDPAFKNFKSTILCHIIEYFENENGIPEVDAAQNECGYNLSHKKLHEAAYDAYLTGLSFLAMSKTLLGSAGDFKNLPQSSLLQPILNKLSIRKLCDIPYMNIGGEDSKPDRSSVYYLTFPIEWKKDDIQDLFKECGFINIAWIDSSSAFVKVKNEFKQEVEKNLMGKTSVYNLCTYEQYQRGNHNKTDLMLSPLLEKVPLKSDRNQINNDHSQTKSIVSEVSKKRQIEDIGEVISRPQKKQFTCQ